MITKEQLILANIFGTMAILISILPFMYNTFSIYRDVEQKKNYSLIESIIKMYIMQVAITFFFVMFVRFWDLLVKKDIYKLQGAGKAFAIFWGDCQAGLNGATEESIKSMYAYMCLIKPTFEASLSFIIFLLPVIVFTVSYFKLSKSKNNYIEGEDVFKNLFSSFIYVFVVMVLVVFYFEILNVSLFYTNGTIIDMVQKYWHDLLKSTLII